VIVETSIDHAKAKPLFGAVRGVVLASRYLIEPCGSGRSRVIEAVFPRAARIPADHQDVRDLCGDLST